MPKKFISESEIRKLAEKYVHTVKRDPNKIPNIQNLITDALRQVSHDRTIETEDVASVISKLSRYGKINDKLIQEAAKKVIDKSATDDLRHIVQRNIQQFGNAGKPEDVDAIIDRSKLDPHESSLQSIKNAVRDFYSQPKSLESMSPSQIRDLVKSQMGAGASNSDVQDVLNQYLDSADSERPFDAEAVQRIIHGSTGPTVNQSQVSRGQEVEQGRAVPASAKADVKGGNWVPPKDPRNPTFFEKIRLKLRRYGIKSLTKGSRHWLKDSVNKVNKPPNRQSLIQEGQTLADALVGRMFMYYYDAKWKEELPYWDKFPLIFVIELYKDGWLGLNLHYLPLQIRTRLFDKLLKFANDKSLDKITKLRLSYQLLKSVSQFPEVQPTIKRYLSSHVKSRLLRIDPVDWEIALFVPVEQFKKQKKEVVWADSKKMIQKLKKKRR